MHGVIIRKGPPVCIYIPRITDNLSAYVCTVCPWLWVIPLHVTVYLSGVTCIYTYTASTKNVIIMYDDNVEPQYFTIVKSALLTNDVTT